MTWPSKMVYLVGITKIFESACHTLGQVTLYESWWVSLKLMPDEDTRWQVFLWLRKFLNKPQCKQIKQIMSLSSNQKVGTMSILRPTTGDLIRILASYELKIRPP